ncbi:MAG: hypothetical protein RI935_610 [Candidatus Parcubacteria bacterium]|jgi:hypothetical protein
MIVSTWEQVMLYVKIKSIVEFRNKSKLLIVIYLRQNVLIVDAIFTLKNRGG